MTLERGTLLHKRYRIVEILGQGGMGSVYRAVDENLGVDVAVKENLFTTDEYARQFRLEAVILANLRHPNLPRVTDHFVIGDQGQYLVMDYIEGEDLRQRMERMGNITEDEAILLGASICDALTYLHTRKPPILHRDIKPGNIKITPDGHIFLVDFGLAKVQHGNQATTTGARAMTPGYSPPEQYGTARTDPRTDIYSLGATLYAALTGIIPEDGLARAMDNTQLTPLRKRNSKVSRRLAAAIEKAMGIDPADRFQTAEEFKRALLGSKSKTQRLPGEYVIQPSSSENAAGEKQSSAQQEIKPLASLREEAASAEELPVFKPPKKKRKKSRILPVFLSILFLLSAGLVGMVRFAPQLLPPIIRDIIPSPVVSFINNVPLFAPATPTPTSVILPTSTEALVVAVTEPSPTATLPPTATFTPTLAATATLPPVVEMTATPTNTPIPVATLTGGGGGQIAFASSSPGIPQIYLVNLDGSGLTQLTNVEGGACQPDWSPDGKQIVFISPCPARADFTETLYKDASLYVMNADGSDIQPLNAGTAFDPAWSPDGKRIAFTSLRDGKKDIYVLSLESGVITRLTTVSGDVQENSQPAWSPSGEQIAYMVKRFNAYQVWVMNDAGQGNTQVARSGQSYSDFLPLWTSDGETILFSQKDVGIPSRAWLMSIRYVDIAANSPTRLNLPRPIEDVDISPDGKWIVFESFDSNGNRDIYLMTLGGEHRTRLTTDPAVDFDPAWRPSP